MPADVMIESNPVYHAEGENRRFDRRSKEEKKADIVNAVVQFYDDNDYSPSEREIMEACSFLSLSTTRQLVTELLGEGKLIRTQSPTRFLRPAPGRR